jgi:2,4-didehydro-3-deoxy-L-rhamnonate hydrolase
MADQIVGSDRSGLTWSLVTGRALDGTALVGALRADGTVAAVPPLSPYAGLQPVFAAGVDIRAALDGFVPDPTAPALDVTVQAPIRFPTKLLCAGANYWSHVLEMTGAPAPAGARPWFFSVPPSTTIIGPGEAVLIPPDPGARVDWEAELAVVIGAPMRFVSPDQALAKVAGYTILNDVSARGLSRPAVPLAPPMSIDWVRSKAHDTFCPMGPGVTPAWLVPDPGALPVRMWLNGELMQDGVTSDMIFDIGTLLSELSETVTLEAGDVVATGTPAGTGIARGRYLCDGDEMVIEIAGLGRLANPVRLVSR